MTDLIDEAAQIVAIMHATADSYERHLRATLKHGATIPNEAPNWNKF